MFKKRVQDFFVLSTVQVLSGASIGYYCGTYLYSRGQLYNKGQMYNCIPFPSLPPIH